MWTLFVERVFQVAVGGVAAGTSGVVEANVRGAAGVLRTGGKRGGVCT